jgi:hypothetical protein
MRGQRHAPAALYPRERPSTLCTGGWLGPRAGLDRWGKSRPPPGFDPRTVQPVASRYTDYAPPDGSCSRSLVLHCLTLERGPCSNVFCVIIIFFWMSCTSCSCRKFGILSSLCVSATRPHDGVILIVRSVIKRERNGCSCRLGNSSGL